MRNTIIAGNWKMNKDLRGAKDLARGVIDIKIESTNVKTILGVPHPFLSEVAGICQKGHSIEVAAQNLYPMDEGAYTGEVSGPMIKSCGARYVILGHSERRQYFNEDDEFVNEKVRYAIRSGLTPILCIGEPLGIREKGEHLDFVLAQLMECMKGIDSDQAENIILAYEPIWAIGTGKTAEPEQAQEMHAGIRAQLNKDFGEVAKEIPILYGGSMKAKNAESLLQCEDIDGGLIGGASLESSSFNAIRTIADSLS